jgi:5-methyltetrahydrofolate--homocysteine methyltransferase
LNRSRDKDYLTIEQARKNKLQLNWKRILKNSQFYRYKTIEVDLDVLVPYIDWTPFRTWQLFKISGYTTDEIVGRQTTAVLQMHNKC